MINQVFILISLFALCCFLYGIIITITKVEQNSCKMTYMYSYPQFIVSFFDLNFSIFLYFFLLITIDPRRRPPPASYINDCSYFFFRIKLAFVKNFCYFCILIVNNLSWMKIDFMSLWLVWISSKIDIERELSRTQWFSDCGLVQ
jgi:hypothetical protein